MSLENLFLRCLLIHPILSSTILHLDLIDRINLMRTCRQAYTSVNYTLGPYDIDKYLSTYIQNPASFRHLLKETGAVVAGGMIDTYRGLPDADDHCTMYLPAMLKPTRNSFDEATYERSILRIRSYFHQVGAVLQPDTSNLKFCQNTFIFNNIKLVLLHKTWNDPVIQNKLKHRALLTHTGSYIMDRKGFCASLKDPRKCWYDTRVVEAVLYLTKSTFRPARKELEKFSRLEMLAADEKALKICIQYFCLQSATRHILMR
jgi:hypothetical protein